MKMEITVTIKDKDERNIIETVEIASEIPEFEDFNGADDFRNTFDTYERAVLKARNQAAQMATESYLSELSKKNPFFGLKKET